MRVIDCGGRDNPDYGLVFETLDRLHEEYRFTLLVNGRARGVDAYSSAWARSRGVPCQELEAKWDPYGDKSAGAARNQEMLTRWLPKMVIAFEGGNGTADMVKRARKAGVQVIEASSGPIEEFME